MGNHSFLKIRQHIEELILKTERPEQAEEIHDLVHSLELLVQIEHMNTAMFGLKRDDGDFPNQVDFD